MPWRFVASSTASPRQSLRFTEQNAARPASSNPPSIKSFVSSSYGQSSGPLSAAGLTVTLGGTELSENGETSFEFGRSEHVTAELVPSDGVTVSDWAFGGLIGELGGLLPGAAGVKVSCTGIMPPVVNKETGGTPATAIYVAQDYAPQGQTGQIIVTAFVGDKYYQSTFQVHTVTKETGGHDGATARAVGVAALAGIAAVLLMG